MWGDRLPAIASTLNCKVYLTKVCRSSTRSGIARMTSFSQNSGVLDASENTYRGIPPIISNFSRHRSASIASSEKISTSLNDQGSRQSTWFAYFLNSLKLSADGLAKRIVAVCKCFEVKSPVCSLPSKIWKYR